jgi:hypothetical protein
VHDILSWGFFIRLKIDLGWADKVAHGRKTKAL